MNIFLFFQVVNLRRPTLVILNRRKVVSLNRRRVVSFTGAYNYQVKFRGYETAWIFLDKVQVGPPDWRTLLGIDVQYLNTPVFLPNTFLSKTRGVGDRAGSTMAASGKYQLFPNPVSSVLYLNNNNQAVHYKVIDLLGRMVLKGVGSRIEVSGLRSGTYFVVVEEKEKRRFIKQ